MKVIDLTHTLREDMPVFPGTEPPKILDGNTIERDGFAEKILTFYTHTGTHIDAPCHIHPHKRSLDEFPVDKFMGRGIVIDVKGVEAIDRATLIENEKAIDESDFVFFSCGWEKRWGSPEYYTNFPALTEDAARWLSLKDLKGIGIDAISLDRMEDEHLPIHRILLEREFIFIENLKNLEKLVGRTFTLSCLPLRFEGADGAPVRAVALLK